MASDDGPDAVQLVQGRCEKCEQEVVRPEGSRFWVLPSEQGTGRATFCPEGGIHQVEDDD